MTATKPKTEGREVRAITNGLELRSAEGTAGRTASGYAALFGVRTAIGSWFTEEIAFGAFTKSLQERDVVALHSHDSGRVVGRKGAGTLTLREDATGLTFENELPDTSDGNDLAVQIGRKDIAGMSFGFITRRAEWDETVDPPHRTILEAELFEITYTAFPQYPETDVALRSLEHARAERRDHNKSAASCRIARRMRLQHTERKL